MVRTEMAKSANVSERNQNLQDHVIGVSRSNHNLTKSSVFQDQMTIVAV